MKTVHRYILWELFQTFFFSLLAMTALLILVGLVREAVDKNVPIQQIFRLVPFVMLEMSRISIPMTFLLAVTTFFAKMSGNNEVIALKSLGIAPWSILWPVMILGVLVSLATVRLNEMAVTWGRAGVAAVIYGAAEDIILNQLRTKHSFSSPNGDMTIMVRGVENRRLVSPTITLKNPPSVIEAQSAQLKIDFMTQELTVSLVNVKAESDGNMLYSADERPITLPLGRVIKQEDANNKRPSDMGLHEIPEEIAEYEARIDGRRRVVATEKAFAVILGGVDRFNTPAMQSTLKAAKGEKKHLFRLNAEPPRRWATGFSCLFFIWLGAPLAIWMKKTDVFSSFFACFVPILLVYYPLLMFGMQGAKGGTLPANSVWIANIFLGIAGFIFLRRIHRY